MEKAEALQRILKKFDQDRKVVVSSDLSDGGVDPLFPRLERAALNQLYEGNATPSRYGIWANTARDNILEALKLVHSGKYHEAERFLVRAANSLSAFAEIQALYEENISE